MRSFESPFPTSNSAGRLSAEPSESRRRSAGRGGASPPLEPLLRRESDGSAGFRLAAWRGPWLYMPCSGLGWWSGRWLDISPRFIIYGYLYIIYYNDYYICCIFTVYLYIIIMCIYFVISWPTPCRVVPPRVNK